MNTSENQNAIFPKGEKTSPDYFTGTAWLNMLVPQDETGSYAIGNVVFKPGSGTTGIHIRRTNSTRNRWQRLLSGKRETSTATHERRCRCYSVSRRTLAWGSARQQSHPYRCYQQHEARSCEMVVTCDRRRI